MKLLHLDASVLGQHSVSRELSAAIVDQLAQENPSLEIAYRDLGAHPLPHWTPVMDAESPAAKLGEAVMDEFLAADILVIGAPMYNFGIPSQLKAWIDRVAQAGRTFKYTENGPVGLSAGRRVIVASTRGGMYSVGPGAVMDFQEAYLKAVFGFLGITDVKFVRAERLTKGGEIRTQSLEAAQAAVSNIVVSNEAA